MRGVQGAAPDRGKALVGWRVAVGIAQTVTRTRRYQEGQVFGRVVQPVEGFGEPEPETVTDDIRCSISARYLL